jgi:hypothetical protein
MNAAKTDGTAAAAATAVLSNNVVGAPPVLSAVAKDAV